MSQPFLGEIRIFAGNFAPFQWAACNGQILPISQNAALFSLLGVQFGGNGTSNFALPNFQGIGPMHFGTGPGLTTRVIGESAGATTVTLLQTTMPSHSHSASCDTVGGNSPSPVGNVWAEEKKGKGSTNLYSDVSTSPAAMAAAALGTAGGSQPHNNLSPYLALTFIIAMAGVFPARN